jgi:hypothetical protein
MPEHDKPQFETWTFGDPADFELPDVDNSEPVDKKISAAESFLAPVEEESPPSDQIVENLLRDFSTGLYSLEELAHRSAQQKDHVAVILTDPAYQPVIMRYRAEWLADDNQGERVRRRARIVVEEGIGSLGKQLLDSDSGVSIAQRLAVFDSVAKLTGLASQADQGTGPRMAINIHISGRDAVQIRSPLIEQQPDTAA